MARIRWVFVILDPKAAISPVQTKSDRSAIEPNENPKYHTRYYSGFGLGVLICAVLGGLNKWSIDAVLAILVARHWCSAYVKWQRSKTTISKNGQNTQIYDRMVHPAISLTELKSRCGYHHH